MKHWWLNTETVTIEVDDVIEHIPFEKLEEEYKKRLELKENDPDSFAKEERYNSDEIDVDICTDDYDLVKRDEVTLNEFDDIDIKFYLENRGYNVFEKGCIYESAIDGLAIYLEDIPVHKRKDFLCDILGIGHYNTKEDILNTLREKL